MSIYLAWSVYKLIGCLVIWASLMGVLIWTTTKQNTNISTNQALFGSVAGLVLILSMALNIGDRQQELGRSNFNASAPETVDKIETNRQNINSVKQAFEQAVSK